MDKKEYFFYIYIYIYIYILFLYFFKFCFSFLWNVLNFIYLFYRILKLVHFNLSIDFFFCVPYFEIWYFLKKNFIIIGKQISYFYIRFQNPIVYSKMNIVGKLKKFWRCLVLHCAWCYPSYKDYVDTYGPKQSFKGFSSFILIISNCTSIIFKMTILFPLKVIFRLFVFEIFQIWFLE